MDQPGANPDRIKQRAHQIRSRPRRVGRRYDRLPDLREDRSRASRSFSRMLVLQAEIMELQGQPEPSGARHGHRGASRQGPRPDRDRARAERHAAHRRHHHCRYGRRPRARHDERPRRAHQRSPARPCRWRSSVCPKCRPPATCSTPSPTSAWRAQLAEERLAAQAQRRCSSSASTKVSLEDLFAPHPGGRAQGLSTSSSRRTCRAAREAVKTSRSKSSPTRKCACASSMPASARSTSRDVMLASAIERHHRRLQRPSGQRRARHRPSAPERRDAHVPRHLRLHRGRSRRP